MIEKILPRKNSFLTTLVSNIDQAIIVTSVKEPDFSLSLLDRLLTLMELAKVEGIICLTKLDLISDIEKKQKLSKEFTTHINKLIDKDDIIFTENFLKELEVYSILVNNSQNTLIYIKSLEDNFKKICSFMNSPYSYYRETQKWQSNIKILVSHLVVLSLLKGYKNISELYSLYVNTKKQFNCYQEKEIDTILNQFIPH